VIGDGGRDDPSGGDRVRSRVGEGEGPCCWHGGWRPVEGVAPRTGGGGNPANGRCCREAGPDPCQGRDPDGGWH
jgi:hypothetical protein